MNMDGIATHIEATVAVALESGRLWPNSTILELGCGDYSTPVLHRIAAYQRRPMINMVSDSNWAARFLHFIGTAPAHYFRFIGPDEKWETVEFPSNVGMALMDNEQPVVDRFENLKRMGDVSIIVAHDAGHMSAKGCSWPAMKAYFSHVVLLGRRYPQTPGTLERVDVAVLSNQVDPAVFFHPGQVEVV